MTWSYSGDPTSSNKDQVRFLIGDVDSSDKLIQDEEINYALGLYSVVTTTPLATLGAVAFPAAECAEAIAAKFARLAQERQVGGTRGVRLQASNKQGQYEEVARTLRRKAGMTIYIGGISEADKESYQEDDDAVQPFFSRGMMKEGIVSAASSQIESDDSSTNASDDEGA